MSRSKYKTRHCSRDRAARERFIKETIGYGEPVDTFYWDRGHPDAPEEREQIENDEEVKAMLKAGNQLWQYIRER